MMINDIISRIVIRDGIKDYFAFETFVLSLLEHHLSLQGKTIQREPNDSQFFDAIAPQGVDSIEGFTAIEVKLGLRLTLHSFIKQIENFQTKYSQYHIKNILVVTDVKPNSAQRVILRTIESKLSDIKIHIWGPDELNKIVSKHKKKTNDIVNNLFSLRIGKAVSQPTKSWKDSRQEIINNVCALYKRGQFSIFVGAGVSSSAGMPDWNTLLNSLLVTYLANEFEKSLDNSYLEEIVRRFDEIGSQSALMAARYLRRGLTKSSTDAKNFHDVLKKSLYSLRDTKKSIDSDLIVSIANLCMPMRTGAKVKSVVTYNFDDLIERQLEKRDIQYRSIFLDTDTCDPDELPIFHVHGYLPESTAAVDRVEQNSIVFSEEGYHQIYKDPYHWSNLVQLSCLRDNHCLMIGLSMTDPNLRRLLDIAARGTENVRHFTFMKRIDKEAFCYSDGPDSRKIQVISDMNVASTFLEMHHRLNEELMKELGVTIIWFEKYEEIPIIINDIKKSSMTI